MVLTSLLVRLTGFHSMVAAAAENWDGSDPVRKLG